MNPELTPSEQVFLSAPDGPLQPTEQFASGRSRCGGCASDRYGSDAVGN